MAADPLYCAEAGPAPTARQVVPMRRRILKDVAAESPFQVLAQLVQQAKNIQDEQEATMIKVCEDFALGIANDTRIGDNVRNMQSFRMHVEGEIANAVALAIFERILCEHPHQPQSGKPPSGMIFGLSTGKFSMNGLAFAPDHIVPTVNQEALVNTIGLLRGRTEGRFEKVTHVERKGIEAAMLLSMSICTLEASRYREARNGMRMNLVRLFAGEEVYHREDFRDRRPD